ncbi:MAG: nucleotidyltransferase substrate binding protein [Hyphomonas sp.]|jgi:nucleotidyltransferase substrate binding protein (TIGR01987 family)|nr:nucleotidyltransferase substrate binding protein [Hyphomonas sp.]
MTSADTGERMALDLTPLDRAVSQLETFLALSLQPQDRPVMNDALRMAAIQAFEYSYELTVKMLRRFLEMTEPNPRALDDATFQGLIRLGCERGLLKSDLPVWMDFRRQRGTTSHAYDAAKAAEVHAAIPAFLAEAQFLLAELHRRNDAT